MSLATMEGRKLLIQAIENDEEKERKEESLRQVEIFNDRLHQHVYGELDKTFSSPPSRGMEAE